MAFDKINSKIEQMRSLCAKMNAECIECSVQDSTKIGKPSRKILDFEFSILFGVFVTDFDKYLANSFDRILVDAPCSALGQRPLIFNNIDLKQLGSYVSYQRLILENVGPYSWTS